MSPSDHELISRHCGGDPEAFNELVRRHQDRLWAIALRTMGSPEDAADALQDGLVSAFRRADTFRGDAAVTTWLHRIVVNACIDRLRGARSRIAFALPDDLDEGSHGSVLTSTSEDPGAAVLTSERRTAVLKALRSLPAEQRAALVLVDMEGYSVQEAAQILDCPDGTVKSRCARGRAKLIPLLSHLLAEFTPVPSQASAVGSSATKPLVGKSASGNPTSPSTVTSQSAPNQQAPNQQAPEPGAAAPQAPRPPARNSPGEGERNEQA